MGITWHLNNSVWEGTAGKCFLNVSLHFLWYTHKPQLMEKPKRYIPSFDTHQCADFVRTNFDGPINLFLFCRFVFFHWIIPPWIGSIYENQNNVFLNIFFFIILVALRIYFGSENGLPEGKLEVTPPTSMWRLYPTSIRWLYPTIMWQLYPTNM